MNRQNRFSAALVTMLVLVLCTGCSSLREQAFKNTEGNSVLLVNNEVEVKKALLMTLAGKGFQAESKEGVSVIKARKVIGDGGRSCNINMDCFLFNMNENGTRLQVAATEEISETSSHIKYFWLLFIPIPYGSYNTTAITESNSINDKIFYAAFFKEVQNNLAETARK